MRWQKALALAGAGTGALAGAGVGGWAIYNSFIRQSRAYIFANWQNYMSPAAQSYLAQKYDVGFTNYGNNTDLIGLYLDGSYDLAVPSDYLLPQLVASDGLRAFDWSRFDVPGGPLLGTDELANYYDYRSDGALVGYYPGSGASVATPVPENDPINLFNAIVQRMIVNFRGADEGRFNLLRYGVPYFMQDLVFAYRGERVDALAPENEPT